MKRNFSIKGLVTIKKIIWAKEREVIKLIYKNGQWVKKEIIIVTIINLD